MMRACLIFSFFLVSVAPASGQLHGPPAFGTEVFFGMDFSGPAGDSDIDNLVLETLDGTRQTFTYDQQIPVFGVTVEPYNGALFDEGAYWYESLFVDAQTNSLSGSPHHHPSPSGGNPGGYTWIHPPMITRIFRPDGKPFRVVSIDYRSCTLPFRFGSGHDPSQWGTHPYLVYADPSWRTLELPVFADLVADGSVVTAGGVPFDVVSINGTTGGAFRLLEVSVGQALVLDVALPPAMTVVGAADYILFGTLGVPTPQSAVILPGAIGTMAFAPCASDPTAFPVLFTLAASTSPAPCAPAFWTTTPAPATISLPGGLPMPSQFTVQGIIADAPGHHAVTNAIAVRAQ